MTRIADLGYWPSGDAQAHGHRPVRPVGPEGPEGAAGDAGDAESGDPCDPRSRGSER